MPKAMQSILPIALTFAAWACVHSLLASLWAKRLAERLLGAPARRHYRLGFAVLAALTLAPVAWLTLRLPDRMAYQVGPPWKWLMHGVQAVGAAFMLWTVLQTETLRSTGRSESDRSKSDRSKRDPGGGGRALKTGGLYGVVRHPMYLSSLVVMWFLPAMTRNVLTLFLLMTAYFVLGSIHEEKLLVAQFGQEYVEYRRRVPRILPGARALAALLRGSRAVEAGRGGSRHG